MSQSSLETVFQEQRKEIERLRKSSKPFGELCLDFETLHQELTAIKAKGLPDTVVLESQIRDSLNGLIEEIRQSLLSVNPLLNTGGTAPAVPLNKIQKVRKNHD